MEPGAIFAALIAFFAMFAVFTAFGFRALLPTDFGARSSALTDFLPGSADAVPATAATKAIIATTIDADGCLRNAFFKIPPLKSRPRRGRLGRGSLGAG